MQHLKAEVRKWTLHHRQVEGGVAQTQGPGGFTWKPNRDAVEPPLVEGGWSKAIRECHQWYDQAEQGEVDQAGGVHKWVAGEV
jgi:hypothetical protein